jgi:hypothetical protein
VPLVQGLTCSIPRRRYYRTSPIRMGDRFSDGEENKREHKKVVRFWRLASEIKMEINAMILFPLHSTSQDS